MAKTIISDSDLTEEQLWGIDAFVKWWRNGKQNGFGKRPKFKFAGPSGSGKSTLAKYAIQAVGLDVDSPKVVSVAPTGKAAMVMRNKGQASAKTVHSAIYIPVDNVDEQIREMRSRLLVLRAGLGQIPFEKREEANAEIDHVIEIIRQLQDTSTDDAEFILNPNSALADAELGVCDEASMVNGFLGGDLESFNVPILYIGDQFQLGPVDNSAEESVFFNKYDEPLPVDYELTQIHRQAEGSPIIRYSRALRENRQSELNFYGKMEGEGTLIKVPRSRLTAEHLATAEQIIVGKNDTRHIINANVREFMNRQSAYPEPGDRIVFLKNNKEYNIVNGMLGIIVGDYYNYAEKSGTFKIEVDLEDGRRIIAPLLVSYFKNPGDKDALYDAPAWSRKANLHADFSNAMTCHKCQGSQFRSGILLREPLGKTEVLRRRWEYTGITRFESNAIIGD